MFSQYRKMAMCTKHAFDVSCLYLYGKRELWIKSTDLYCIYYQPYSRVRPQYEESCIDPSRARSTHCQSGRERKAKKAPTICIGTFLRQNKKDLQSYCSIRGSNTRCDAEDCYNIIHTNRIRTLRTVSFNQVKMKLGTRPTKEPNISQQRSR